MIYLCFKMLLYRWHSGPYWCRRLTVYKIQSDRQQADQQCHCSRLIKWEFLTLLWPDGNGDKNNIRKPLKGLVLSCYFPPSPLALLVTIGFWSLPPTNLSVRHRRLSYAFNACCSVQYFHIFILYALGISMCLYLIRSVGCDNLVDSTPRTSCRDIDSTKDIFYEPGSIIEILPPLSASFRLIRNQSGE